MSIALCSTVPHIFAIIVAASVKMNLGPNVSLPKKALKPWVPEVKRQARTTPNVPIARKSRIGSIQSQVCVFVEVSSHEESALTAE